MSSLFTGSATALVTAFDKDGQIDFEATQRLIEWQLKNKTDAVVVCGTTGEGSTLTVSERLKLFCAAREAVGKRVPLICGTGSNSTFFTLDFASKAEECGIDAHLIVTPYYNKTSQQGLVEHYFTLADRLKKPIIVYNVPTRTGMNVLPATFKRLSEHENIIAAKQADANISNLINAMVLCGDKLDFYIGNDDLISVAASLGCKGVISVMSNIIPRFTHELAVCKSAEKSSDMQKSVMELIECLFSDVSPIMIKQIMSMAGLSVGSCRLPLVPCSDYCVQLSQRVLRQYRQLIEEETASYFQI